MNEFETMESMYSRLKGTGGGAQAEAVISSIKLIRKAHGVLDSTNVAVALYHIAIALVGNERARVALENTVGYLTPEEEKWK
jgi:hypothetical protein